jgi:hypothetical protein
MTTPSSWTFAERQAELVCLEAKARRSLLAVNSVHTYVDRAERFVR